PIAPVSKQSADAGMKNQSPKPRRAATRATASPATTPPSAQAGTQSVPHPFTPHVCTRPAHNESTRGTSPAAMPGNTALRGSRPYQSRAPPARIVAAPNARVDAGRFATDAAARTTSSTGTTPRIERRSRPSSYAKRARLRRPTTSIEAIEPPERAAKPGERPLPPFSERRSGYRGGLLPVGRDQRLAIGLGQLPERREGGLDQVAPHVALFRIERHRRLEPRLLGDLPPPHASPRVRATLPGGDRQRPGHGRALRIVLGSALENLLHGVLQGVGGVRLILQQAETQSLDRREEQVEDAPEHGAIPRGEARHQHIELVSRRGHGFGGRILLRPSQRGRTRLPQGTGTRRALVDVRRLCGQA